MVYEFGTWDETNESVLLIAFQVSIVCDLLIIHFAFKAQKIRFSPSVVAFECITGMNLIFSTLSTFELYFHDFHCERAAPWIEFTIIAQELYVLFFSANLVESLRNPFQSSQVRAYKLHALILFFSGIFAILLASSGHGGDSVLGLCWIDTAQGAHSIDEIDATNVWFLMLFLLPVVSIWLINVVVMIWVRRELQRRYQMADDAESNSDQMSRHTSVLVEQIDARSAKISQLNKVALGHSVYWLLVAVLVGIERAMTGDSPVVGLMLIWVLGCKGLMLLGLFWAMLPAWNPTRALEVTRDNNSINKALRQEVLTLTSLGIVQSLIMQRWVHVVLSVARDKQEDKQLFWRLLLFECAGCKRGLPNSWAEASVQVEEGENSGPQYKKTTLSFSWPNEESAANDTLEFTDYCAETFAQMRQAAGIGVSEYAISMRGQGKEQFSEGASGAFLYFKDSQKYIVKTCNSTELNYLMRVLPALCKYCKQHPDTIINTICGVHEITMYNQRIRFMVVRSFYQDMPIHQRFDLKGSWYGRITVPKPPGSLVKCLYCNLTFVVGDPNNSCEHQPRHDYDRTGKDLNFTSKLHLTEQKSRQLAVQLCKDADFLASINALDYSLLLGRTTTGIDSAQFTAAAVSGIHKSTLEISAKKRLSRSMTRTPRGVNALNRSRSMSINSSRDESDQLLEEEIMNVHGGLDAVAVEGPAQYFLAIIDLFKEWDWWAQSEYWLKVYILRQDRDGISCQPPQWYAHRFKQRVVEAIIVGKMPQLELLKTPYTNCFCGFYSNKEFVEPGLLSFSQEPTTLLSSTPHPTTTQVPKNNLTRMASQSGSGQTAAVKLNDNPHKPNELAASAEKQSDGTPAEVPNAESREGESNYLGHSTIQRLEANVEDSALAATEAELDNTQQI